MKKLLFLVAAVILGTNVSNAQSDYTFAAGLGLDLFSGVTGYSIFGQGIAHFAHLGGALFGFIMMWYWKRNQFNGNRWN